MGSPHLKCESGASPNAREHTIERKVDMGENLRLKYCLKLTFTSETHVFRIGGALIVASLKSYVSIGWDPRTENASVARL